MSKGINISHIADGEYSVEIELDTSAIDAEIVKLDEKIAAITDEIDSIPDQITDLDSDIVDKEAEISPVKSDINTKNSEISVIDARLLAIPGEIVALDAEIAVLYDEIAVLYDEIAVLDPEMNSLVFLLAAIADEIASLGSQISILEAEAADPETTPERLAEITIELASLNSDKDDLTAQHSEVSGEYFILSDEKSALEADKSALVADIIALEGAKAVLELEVTTITADRLVLVDEVSDLESELDSLNAELKELQTERTKLQFNLKIFTLEKTALEKRKAYLEDPANVPENPVENIWCVDLTEDLSGDVGILEIAGLRDGGQNIQPGHEGNAVYDGVRDGKLRPAIATPSPETYWDWAMQGGWQKWKPTYRWGIITAIDHDLNTCDIQLDPQTNPDSGLDVNQTDTLSDVEIEYMNCDSSAFDVADIVVIEFEDNDWSKPKVIGFKSDPKACLKYCVAKIGLYSTVFNMISGEVADDIPTNADPEVMATFPVLSSEISDWVSGKEERTLDSLFSSESESGDFGTIVFTNDRTPWNNDEPCEGDEWKEDHGSDAIQSWIGNKVGIFGTNSYNKNGTDSGKFYADCPETLFGEGYWWNDNAFTLTSTQYIGFRLTALNGSEDTLDWKAVATVTSSRSRYTHYESYTYDCDGYTYDSNYSKVVSKSGSYFSISGSGTQNIVGTASGCTAGDPNDIAYDPDDPAVSTDIDIGYAAHYSETYNAVIQLFVYKDDDDAYHGYGQADVGLGDYSVAPTSLAEVGALSSALGSLAVAADSNGISAKYY